MKIIVVNIFVICEHLVAAELEVWLELSTETMNAHQYTNYGMNFGSDKVSDSIVNIRLGQCDLCCCDRLFAMRKHNLGDPHEGCACPTFYGLVNHDLASFKLWSYGVLQP